MSFEDWTGEAIERLALDIFPRSPTPHQSIFKYVGLNTKTSWSYLERTLNECVLVGSTFNALNDPFELSPHLFNDLRPKTIAAATGYSTMKERLSGENLDPETAFADVRKYELEARDHFEKIQRDARIIAFCDRSDSPLLWSHYANSYKGACIHFVGGAFGRREGNFGYVSYSSHRPSYPLSLALELGHKTPPRNSGARIRQEESNKLIFYTKAADWAYEREVRIVYNYSRQTSVKFNSDGLLSIITGPRMSEEDRKQLNNLIARSKVPHLQVREARLSSNSFSVEID